MSDNNLNDHVSAGELRDHGIEISDTIPDCAETPRCSLRVKYNVKVGDDGSVNGCMQVHFTEPFRWIEGTLRVEAKHEPTK